jgi:DUF2946 family protein
MGNVIASAFCCAPSSSRRTEIVDPILGAIPLCTNALSSADGSDKQPKSSKQHCPVCLAAANKALVVTATELPFTPEALADASALRADVPAVGERLKVGGLGSRAPPLLV